MVNFGCNCLGQRIACQRLAEASLATRPEGTVQSPLGVSGCLEQPYRRAVCAYTGVRLLRIASGPTITLPTLTLN